MARALRIGIAVVLLGLAAYLATKLEFETRSVPMPLAGEARSNPFFAVEKLAAELGAEASWERVFTMPRQDAVLMLSTWSWSLSRPRRESIERWVEAGGRLVVDRSMTSAGGGGEFEQWSGVSQVDHAHHDDDEEDEDDGTGSAADAEDGSLASRLLGEKCTPLLEDGTSRGLRVCGIDDSVSLTTTRKVLWALRDSGRIHALRVAVDRGSVTVINAVPFKHRDLFLGDHGQLFARATQLARGDEITILTEQDHPSLLTLVWRFGAPAVLLALAAIGFALWRAGVRFGPPAAATDPARRSLAEQIRGTGRFALRFGAGRALHAATARALRDAAIPKLPAYDRMSGAERVAALARLTGVSADDLSPALNSQGSRSAHELRHAIAILESARRSLTGRSNKHGN